MRALLFLLIISVMASCNTNTNSNTNAQKDNTALNQLFDNYYEKRLQLFPLEATQNGDIRYNSQLPVDFTDDYRDTLKQFFSKYLDSLKTYQRASLNDNDKISYDIFKTEMEVRLEDFKFPDNYMPFNQFAGLPLSFGQLGSGSGNQPFKTKKDYSDWQTRVSGFSSWADSAIVYFRKGINSGIVLPKVLVLKMIPQMRAMETTDVTKSIFYGPITNLPDSFSAVDKESLKGIYSRMIMDQVIPAYKRLGDFLENEYLPKARSTAGFSYLPGGKERYEYLVREWTTTSKTGDEIYNLGLQEVSRIHTEMEKIKTQTGFTGDLNSFFEFMKTDKRFTPYKTPEDVLNAFRDIQKRIDPNLKKMFNRTPKTKFEIRQTEAFRAASASIEYQQGSEDGTRPGIFYVPIMDATAFNTTSGMESTFLHEAVPGHHYQVSLQQENSDLPKFRRFAWYGAYGEGWALYCESLGKELGLFTDPYQHMGALGDEILRAIRLVVDVGLHEKNWSREQAIKYMMDNESINEHDATSEIERYMAIPAQALSYKVGAIKLRELRARYEKELGNKFNLAMFHDELLKDGCMPLDVLEQKMDAWAARMK
ncbi:MAG: DUF885 domain-containing protein [Chitinophagaceae bacterium]|nr:DUF885 domain-containing protein [Chitinophagaceae bacterium]